MGNSNNSAVSLAQEEILALRCVAPCIAGVPFPEIALGLSVTGLDVNAKELPNFRRPFYVRRIKDVQTFCTLGEIKYLV